MMGILSIPKINVRLPIRHTTIETVLQDAVGHVENTSLPIGGPNTHCALSGHKADAINTCDKASFCVLDEGKKEDGEWFYRFRSVIVFGRIAFVESEEEKRAVCNALCEKFGQGKDYQDAEWQKYAKNVACLRLKAEHITGKAVKEE